MEKICRVNSRRLEAIHRIAKQWEARCASRFAPAKYGVVHLHRKHPKFFSKQERRVMVEKQNSLIQGVLDPISDDDEDELEGVNMMIAKLSTKRGFLRVLLIKDKKVLHPK
jgi:hypothetical protein